MRRHDAQAVTLALAPLLAAICIEIGLIAFAISLSSPMAVALGVSLALAYILLWYVFPLWKSAGDARAADARSAI